MTLNEGAAVSTAAAKVPIITYHSIDDSGSVVSMAPKVFADQMAYLSAAGYTSMTLRDLITALTLGNELPSKPVVLTFDDGFRNFLTEAFPVLDRYKMTATVFIVTDQCGRHNDWGGNPSDLPRSELLSWSEIRELDRAGIEFASHTASHADLTKLDAEKVTVEMTASKAAIEDSIGREATTFAYPYGRYNAAVEQAAAENFKASCSTNLGRVTPRSRFSALQRIDAYYLIKQRIFEMLDTDAFDKYLRLRQSLRTVKSLVNFG